MAIQDEMRRALRDAMKARDTTAVSALRAGLSVIDNAAAADPSHTPAPTAGTIAGGVAGLGAGEVPRRELTESDIARELLDEAERWRALSGEYERAGRTEDAADLVRQAAIVAAFAKG